MISKIQQHVWRAGLAFLVALSFAAAAPAGWASHGGAHLKHTDIKVGDGTEVVRFAKIQSVVFSQTPFDRRLGMARLQVDTAGSSSELAFVIPYLDREVATELMGRLRRHAAAHEFTW